MEVDYNLKKLANFFKFFLCILEKSLKINYEYFLPGVNVEVYLTKFN